MTRSAESCESDALGKLWIQYASSYDRILPLMPFYRIAVARHVDAILSHRVRSCIDIGCGTGNVALPLAASGIAVEAIDSSVSMLQRLNAKMAGLDCAGSVQTQEGRAEDVAFPPERMFDSANFLLSVYCLDDPVEVLKKVADALRPGALLVFTEPTATFREEPLLDVGRRIIFEDLALKGLAQDWDVVSNAGKTLGKYVREAATTRAKGHRLRAEDLPAVLERIGCCVLRIQDSHLGQCQHIVACKLAR